MPDKKNPVIMTLLFDYYGGMLTVKQSEVYESYHGADLSLAEIAENLGITRQGVHDLLSRAEKTLLNLEDKLGFVQRFEIQKNTTERIHAILHDMDILNSRALSNAQMAEYIKEIRAAVQELVGD